MPICIDCGKQKHDKGMTPHGECKDCRLALDIKIVGIRAKVKAGQKKEEEPF